MRIQREKHKEKSSSQKSVLMEEAVREMERVEPHRALGLLLQIPEISQKNSKRGGKNVVKEVGKKM